MKKLFLLLMIISVFARLALAQEVEPEEFKPKIRGAIMIANSHVPHATEGGKKMLSFPPGVLMWIISSIPDGQ